VSPDAVAVRRHGESTQRRDLVQYALLIYRGPNDYDDLTEEERESVSAEYYAIRDDPRVLGGAALHPVDSATTVRIDEGQTLVTDGPFANTKEVFGGWYVVDAPDLDAALEIARRIPAVRLGGSVELRPVVEARR
jgi:hypothetical protein